MWVDGTGWERLKEGFQLYLKKKYWQDLQFFQLEILC